MLSESLTPLWLWKQWFSHKETNKCAFEGKGSDGQSNKSVHGHPYSDAKSLSQCLLHCLWKKQFMALKTCLCMQRHLILAKCLDSIACILSGACSPIMICKAWWKKNPKLWTEWEKNLRNIFEKYYKYLKNIKNTTVINYNYKQLMQIQYSMVPKKVLQF